LTLVKSQLALLPPELDETLESFPSYFCFMLLSFRTSRPHHEPVFANASQVCADSKSLAMTPKARPGISRKKPQIGHRDGPLQEPALIIQDEVFARHNKQRREDTQN